MIQFPNVVDQKVLQYSMILELQLTFAAFPNTLNFRKYYQVEYENHTSLIFMTTDEMDESFNERQIDHDFEIYFDTDQLFKGFEKVFDLEFFAPKGRHYHSLPNFIYYDIMSIEESVYLKFRFELFQQTEGYVASDFDQFAARRIDYWLNFIS